MYKIFLCILFVLFGMQCYSQNNSLIINVIDSHNSEPLVGATVFINNLEKGDVTDHNGQVALKVISTNELNMSISFIGYGQVDTLLSLADFEKEVFIYLVPHSEEMEEVIVKATRSTRSIQNIPTRIEFISEEELTEKAIMNAANISLVLRESTGIQIQQSSLSSGNSSIRIQGLDGRYTQLLKDGFPLFGGFSGGLSIMQIPPLDLQQFEIVKGSQSTLYGGGAISGLVNMVSKTPGEEPNMDIMLTGSHAGATTANVFYSKRNGKVGFTIYGAANHQRAYDPDGDDFTNLPKTTTLTLNPKVFFYPDDNSKLWFGLNVTLDDRLGGDFTLIKDGEDGIHQYFEDNGSSRMSTQAVYKKNWSHGRSIEVKNSISFFDRTLETPTYNFNGKENNTFSEASYNVDRQGLNWTLGANVYSNSFDEEMTLIERDQTDITIGMFTNVTKDLNESVILEGGFRTDHSPDWGTFLLPKASILWKANQHFTSRLGGGFGYKIPDIFTEEAAKLNFQNVMPIDKEALNAETSIGLNWDVNFKTVIADKVAFSINQLFYLTSISDPLTLVQLPSGSFEFQNNDENTLSKGAETNVKFSYGDFRWFLNYAYINVEYTNFLSEMTQKPLTPRHNAGTVLMYENDQWRIGFETYYIGSQVLSLRDRSQDFFLMGFMMQKHFEWGSPYINFENFTDRRQSRFSSEVDGDHSSPIFRDIYAPTDGFVFSAGVIIKPFGREHHH